MKKLTKTLSLVLVIAMVVSLCVVGASAKTFSDYKAPTTGTDYTEAIDVMSGVGIIDGMNGGFNAAGNFTRAQAAKIIAYMQLGVTKAEALSFNTNTAVIFSDVPTTFWAYNYIEYCAQQGIITGYGNGKFGPNDTLTGYQWSKMLLSAVGFGVNKEYNGVNWAINAARDGLKYGVFTAKVDATAGSTPKVITRDVATGMAFNTLVGIQKVTYAALIGDYIDGTGNVVTGFGKTLNGLNTNGTLAVSVFKLYEQSGRITYIPAKAAFKVLSGTAYYDAPAATYDVYGYAAHVWTVGTKTITAKTYVDSTVLGTTVGAGDALYTAKTGYMNPQSKSYVASADESALVGVITGTPVTDVDDAAYGDAAGMATFKTVASANAAFVSNEFARRGVAVTLLDDDGDGDADTFAVLNKEVLTLTAKPVTKTVDGVDYVKVVGAMSDYVKASMADGYKDLAAGDTVLWFVDCTGTYHFAKAAEVTGAYTGYKTVADVTSYTIGDKSQPLSQLYITNTNPAATYAGPKSTASATYYTDDFGYWCGDKTVTTDPVVYMLGADWHNLSGMQAKVLFAETGKVETVTVSKLDGVSPAATDDYDSLGLVGGTDNGWYKAVKVSDGVYKLTEIATGHTLTNAGYAMRNNAARFLTNTPNTTSKANYWTGDSTTKVFTQASDGSFAETVGVLNAPVCTINGTLAYIDDGSAYGFVSHAIIFNDSTNVLQKNLLTAYFYGLPHYLTYDAVNDIYTVNAVVSGAAVEGGVKVSGDVYAQLCEQPGLYFNSTRSSDVVVALGTFATEEDLTDDTIPGGALVSQAGEVVMAKSRLVIDGTQINGAYDDNTKIFTVNASGKLSSITAAEVAELGYLDGAMVAWTYSTTDHDLITSVVVYAPAAAGVKTVAAPTFNSTTAVNGLNITGVTADKSFVLAGENVTYTVTVAGTETVAANTQNVVMTYGSKTAVKDAEAAGTYTFTAPVTSASFALVDTTVAP